MPGRLNLRHYHGDSFRLSLLVKNDGVPVNFVSGGYTAKFIVRKYADSAPTLEVGTATGEIVLGSAGQIDVHVVAADMDVPIGDYTFDLVMTVGSDVDTYLAGEFEEFGDMNAEA